MAEPVRTTDQKPQAVIRSPRATQLIDSYNQLKAARSNFDSYWQSLHDYFYIEAPDINKSYSAGTELSIDYLYDATTLEAADVLPSGFMNYLTPPTSKWAVIRPKNAGLKDNKKIGRWCDDVMDQVHYTLNRSNFYDQMFVGYKSSGVYGTSAMLEEDDPMDDIRFMSLPLKNVCLVEDGRGRVKQFFIEFEFTSYQAATRWGVDALSDKMKEEIRQDTTKDNKHKFLLVVAERFKRDIGKSDKRNLPIEALWIDIESKLTIEESGYNEFPAFCHRFDKRPFIPWGFSPAMKALPFARTLQAIAKTNLRVMMKHADPAIALPDNAFIMPFSQNPRAINYYNKNKMSKDDIFTFGNYGDPNVGMTAIEYYSQKVKTLMYYDTFLAFSGLTKQMNNPEVMERINEKMSMLGPAVGRWIGEVINPVIIRTIGILARKGKLPPYPDEFLLDPEYEIDCISQLAQAQRRSELNSLMSGLTLVGQMSPMLPEVVDKLDADKVVDEAWNIIGAPVRVLRDDDDVNEIRQARADAAMKKAQMANVEQMANAVNAGSQADKNIAQASAATRGE